MFQRTLAVFVTACVFLGQFAVGQDHNTAGVKPRTWTDLTGKFSVSATFVSFSDGQIQLKKNDGSLLTVPAEKLSKDDQRVAAFFRDFGNALTTLQSPDQEARVVQAKALLGKELQTEAIDAVLEYIRLEIDTLAASGIKSRGNNPVRAIPFDGNETSLVRIKADPKSFAGKPFIIIGGISASSYYNFGYDNAEDSHYALDFRELGKTVESTGESGHLYVPRTFSGFLVERVTQAEESGLSALLIRAKATINPQRYEGAASWSLMELIDWQIFDAGSGSWKPWALDGFKVGLALVAQLKDIDALVDIASSESAHGVPVVDAYVRGMASATLPDVTIDDFDEIKSLVSVVVAERTQGSERTDAFVRTMALNALCRLDGRQLRYAMSEIGKEANRLRRSDNEVAKGWANRAKERLIAAAKR